MPLKDAVIGGVPRCMPGLEKVPWIWVTGVRPPPSTPPPFYPIPILLSTSTSVCSPQPCFTQKPIIQPRSLQSPRANAFYHNHFPQFKSQQQKKKASRTFQLVIMVLLNARRYKHLALHHFTAPARNVGTINKLYYSTLTFQ